MDGKGEERKIIEKERMKSRGKEGIKKGRERKKKRELKEGRDGGMETVTCL